MRALKLFVSSVLGGACIGLGGVAYLSLENRLAGALFFTVGLFTICTFGFHLFTGKVCYVFQKGGTDPRHLPLIWLGNLAGTGAVAAAVRLTRLAPLAEKAAGLCRVKLEDSLPSVFLLAVLCNVFIYIAVEGFRSNPHEIGEIPLPSFSASWGSSSASLSTVSPICSTFPQLDCGAAARPGICW